MRSLLLVLALLNPVVQLDTLVARRVQESRRPGLEPVMWAASRWGRPVVVGAGLAVVVVSDAAAGNGWGLARLAVATLAGTNLVVEATKRLVDRTRPDGEHDRSNASFPSSHAANAFALAWVLSARWRRGWPAFLGLALLVAFSRMYLNRHFLSDVVGGAVIGLALAWAAQLWLPLRARRARSPAAPDDE